MRSLLRIVLAGLMALAIPLQGLAAVAMPMCGPMHQANMSGAAKQLAMGVASNDHGKHGMPADMATHDHHGMAHGDDTDAHAAGSSEATGHTMLKCCSAACTLVATLTQDAEVRQQMRSPAPAQADAPLWSGVTPDGLDRPPRPVLA